MYGLLRPTTNRHSRKNVKKGNSLLESVGLLEPEICKTRKDIEALVNASLRKRSTNQLCECTRMENHYIFIILEMILYNVLYFQTKAIGLMKASLYSSYRKNSTSESIYKFSISTIF